MGSRRYYYKTLTFTFNSQEEIIHFLDVISRKIKVFQLYARTRGNRNVEIVLMGDPAEVTVAIAELKKIAKTIREMYRKDRGMATYDVRVILDYAKIEAAIPLDVAFKTLELLGYRVEQLKDGKIRTNAEFSKVVEVIEEISRLYKEMMEMDITPQAKRIIAMWCAVFDRTPEEAIAELEALGLLKRYITPERNLVVLAYNYEEAYKKVKEFVDKFRENPAILDELRKIVEEKLLKAKAEEEKLEAVKEAILGEGRIIIKAKSEEAAAMLGEIAEVRVEKEGEEGEAAEEFYVEEEVEAQAKPETEEVEVAEGVVAEASVSTAETEGAESAEAAAEAEAEAEGTEGEAAEVGAEAGETTEGGETEGAAETEALVEEGGETGEGEEAESEETSVEEGESAEEESSSSEEEGVEEASKK